MKANFLIIFTAILMSFSVANGSEDSEKLCAFKKGDEVHIPLEAAIQGGVDLEQPIYVSKKSNNWLRRGPNESINAYKARIEKYRVKINDTTLIATDVIGERFHLVQKKADASDVGNGNIFWMGMHLVFDNTESCIDTDPTPQFLIK